ncbi:MAG: hypothetical protein KA354_11710 [Phycisphaerae bacterium]|nr:hypothetical protein [Phycisphaerae bacterium]
MTAVTGLLFTSMSLTACPVGAAPATQPVPPDDRPAGATPERPIREQSIYIPYTKLRETFEREGRGVFLPYGEFEKLWRAAREKDGPSPDARPPVQFLINEVDHEATVARDVVRVKAQVKIELLAEGWHHVPLGLADAAATQATIGELPARMLFDSQKGYELLLEKRGKAAESVTLTLEYAKAYEKTAGRNRVSFQPPQAPVSRWRIRIPESGVKVNLSPLIAATQIPESGPAGSAAEETVVMAFVGAAPTVQIDWTPKAEGATGLASLATVQAEQQVRIEDGVVRTRTQLAYEISRAALSELVVEVPADQRVINVLDANVRQWSVVGPTSTAPSPAGPAATSAPAAEGTRQQIAIQLFEPARATQNIVIELEKFVSESTQRRLRVPVVAAIGVGRQQGVVVVAAAEGLRTEVVAHTGLLQMDAVELPKSLANWKWLLSYRYASLPFDLTLQVEKVQPRIVLDSLVEATLEPEQLTLDVLAVYTVERAGVFRLEFDVPAGFEVRKVAGRAIADAQPAQVDTHYADGSEKTHLVVNLASKALGRVALVVRLQRRLTEPDLLSPTGRSVSLPMIIPRASKNTVERAAGRLVIYAAESLRVNPGQTKGLRSVSFNEAFEGLASSKEQPSPAIRPVLAFAYAQEDVDLTLAAERRKPQVTARQLLLAQIEAGVIKYSATFTYEILYSGVSSVRIDLPADLAADIRNSTPGIREKVIDPPPKDLAASDVAWSFAGETELTGTVQVRLNWEKRIEELPVGKAIEMSLPHLKPRLVDRAWGQIVWTKVETLDVHESGEPKGVRPIDPQHDLMPGASVAGAARAFEFHDNWDLRVAVTRYKLEEVKRTSIERAVLQMVATRDNSLSVRALYRLRSAGQRLAVKLPDSVEFDNEPLRINGRPAALERGEQGEYFVPLVGLNADTPTLLELRYSVPRGGRRFVPPVFPSDPAIQKVYVCAYLPEELTYLGSRGPWTDEIDWVLASSLRLKPSPRRSDQSLLGWVGEDLNVPSGPGDTFQTDGRLYVFSTLRPTATGDAALRITAMSENWLSAMVFAVIVAVGLALGRSSAARRCLVGGVFLVLLILSGIFLPTFLRQILGTTLIAAVAIVLIGWGLHYLVWIRPHDPVVMARKQARQEAQLARVRTAAAPSPHPAVAAAPPAPETPKDEPKGGEPHA